MFSVCLTHLIYLKLKLVSIKRILLITDKGNLKCRYTFQMTEGMV